MQEPAFSLTNNNSVNVLETPSFAQIDNFTIPMESQGLFAQPSIVLKCS
jgi:hypothetical protein